MLTSLMQFFKKYRLEIISGIFLSLFYFIIRLVRILNVPMFTDEAIYTRWTQIAKQDASWRFISLTDGKQPLFVWINILFMRFIHDPLLSGRCVSVIAGFLTMLGLFLLGKELFKKPWIGISAMLLYVLSPFALVYDRLAIYDSSVGTFYIWGLYCSIILVKKIKLDWAFILGFVLGGAALNKIGIFSIYLLPLNTLLFNFKIKKKWQRLVKWFILLGVAVVIEEAMYAILRLSPWFYIINQKNTTFFYPISDLWHMPLSFWVGNIGGTLPGLTSWLISYLTIPVIVLVLISGVFYKEFWKEKILLLSYFIIPFLGFAILAKVMYPRYLFFMTLPLLLLAAYSLVTLYAKIKNNFGKILISFVAISFALYADFYILTNFAYAPIPQSDLNQLVNDWPAGGGVNQSVAFFKAQAATQKIYIGTEGTFGLMPYGLEIYLKDNPNITIKGIWPINDTPPQSLLTASKTMPTYVLFYQPCPSCKYTGDAPLTWPLHLIQQYSKGIGKTHLSIYQVIP